MNKQNFWNRHNTFKKIPQQNLGGQLLKVDKKKYCLWWILIKSSYNLPHIIVKIL